MEKVIRPWGNYEVLFTGTDCQVKRIEVSPGKRLSLQSHMFRAEHWFIVSGNGIAIIGDQMKEITSGEAIDIPIGVKHRIAADETSPVVFVEVQTGYSFEEDDIIRYEDDFGRSS